MKRTFAVLFLSGVMGAYAQTTDSIAPRVYVGAGKLNSFRSLTPNKAPYGKELGIRADETKTKCWNFDAGYLTQVHPHVLIDAGVSLAQFGESYRFESTSTDSSYAYTNQYGMIALPIQAYATIGSDFQLYLGGGIQPQLLQSFKTQLEVGDSLGNVSKNTTNYLENGAGFSLSARASAGLVWKLQKNISIYVNYTYTQGLTNTYADQEKYVHKAYSHGIRYGLVYSLK